jgi:hypothetical protein
MTETEKSYQLMAEICYLLVKMILKKLRANGYQLIAKSVTFVTF